MSCLRLTLALLCITFVVLTPLRAQLVINEVSNGPSGNFEYVELLVVGTPSCTNSCIDLRGWIIDDNNGTFRAGSGFGIATGHARFSSSAVWSCVPIGTLIVVYNNDDRNALIPPNNLTGANCRFIIPHNNSLIEYVTTVPTSSNPDYTGAGAYSSGNFSWPNVLGLRNGGDSFQTRDPNNLTVPYHAISYGDNNSSDTIVYLPGSGTSSMFYMANVISDDPFDGTNWVEGVAPTNETPGAPNNPANAAWIATLNNNCSPFTAVAVTLGPDVAICPGDSITIRATVNAPGGNFVWNGVSLGSQDSIRIAPTAPTGVIVTYNLSPGCTDSDTLNINIIAPPTGAITGNLSICSGESTTLTASGGGSYVWSTTENTAAITVTPAITTIYTVTVTNAGGCTDTVSATVTVNPQPNGMVTGNTTVCLNDVATLTASGGTSYLWSTTGSTSPTISVTMNVTATASYTVTITDANGCRDTVTTNITVNTPTASITGNTTICTGGSTTLTASGGTSFDWSTTETTASITVSPTTNTTYTVTVTDANGCTATASVTVNVNASITGTVTGNLTICAGESTTLTASGGNTYLWSTAETTAAITVNPITNTVYSVTVTSGTCSDTVTETVTLNAAPTGAITGNTVVCAGESTVLTATGGASYLWSTSETTPAISVSPSANTTYSVTVTGANGCLDTVATTITVNARPIVNAAPDTIICAGNTVALTVTGGSSYLWSTNETTAIISVSPSTTADYSVTVTDANGCTAADTVTVTVNPNNIALAIDSITAETCGQGNGEILLDNPAPFVTYVLVENGVRIDSTLGGAGFFDLTGGVYDIIATDNNGCERTLTGVVVPASAVPQATVDASSPTCFGYANGSITLTSSTAGLYYSLNGGTPQTGNTFSGLAAGNYEIRVIDSLAGCENVIDYNLTQPDVLDAAVSPDSVNIITGDMVELTSSVSGGTTPYSYQWIPATGLDCDTCENVVASPIDSLNVFHLVVTDTNGCVDTARVVIRVTNEFLITVPTGFTPGVDGWNDYLRPLSNEPIDFDLMVFNRWGQKIFEGNGMPGWDGTYKHEPQPIGTYVYVIEYTRLLTGTKGYLTGSITLLR